MPRLRHQSALVLLAAALASLLVGACGTIELAPPPPELPLFKRIDARVGVVYTSAAYNTAIVNPLLRVDVGKASVRNFERAFASMFTTAITLPDWPPWRELDAQARSRIDAVIELARVDAELVFGNDRSSSNPLLHGLTGGVPDRVSIGYHVCLYQPDGTPIRCWSTSSHQVHQRQVGECLDLRTCIGPQVEIAMREALARFLLEAESDPELAAWAAGLAQRVQREKR